MIFIQPGQIESPSWTDLNHLVRLNHLSWFSSNLISHLMGWWHPLPCRGWDLCATSFNASRRENSGVFTEDERIVTGSPWTFWGVYDMLDPNFQTLWDAVDRRNPAISPVEVGTVSHYLQGCNTSQLVQDFFHWQYHYSIWFDSNNLPKKCLVII